MSKRRSPRNSPGEGNKRSRNKKPRRISTKDYEEFEKGSPYANQCKVTGKACYETRKKALTQGHKIIRLTFVKEFKRGFRAYRCRHCNKFHLTTQVQPKEK